MQREFPAAPIAGVGAVVLDDARRVLLVRRGHEPLKGEWSLPGGALELGERLEDGIQREVLEETGLVVEPVEIVAVFDHISHEEADGGGVEPGRVRFHYVLVDYRCRVVGGTLVSATDVTEARWMSWQELTGHGGFVVRPFTLSVIRRALEQAAGRTQPEEPRIVTQGRLDQKSAPPHGRDEKPAPDADREEEPFP